MDWYRTIDNLFVISLPNREDRRTPLLQDLLKRSAGFKIFEATGDDNGERGLCKTMIDIIDTCIELKYKRVLILEDDCCFIESNYVVSRAFSELPADFDFFYLGCNLMSRPERVSENILSVTGAYSSHAILYSANGLKIAYEALVKDEMDTAYDVLLQRQHQSKRYCAYPILCTQRPGVSDIYKHDENNKILEQYYDKKTKSVDWGAFMQRQYSIMTKNI